MSAIIELVRELVICNMHNKFEMDTIKIFQVMRPQGQIIAVTRGLKSYIIPRHKLG